MKKKKIFSTYFNEYKKNKEHKEEMQMANRLMLIITNYQGNANQNYRETAPHTCQNGVIKKKINSNHWWRCGVKGSLLQCWWECQLRWPLWKKIWRFVKNLKNQTVIRHSSSTLGYVSEKNKNLIQNALQCSWEHCLSLSRYVSNLSVP